MNKSVKCYIETYGCQMNFSDSEIVVSILSECGVEQTRDIHSADVIFFNTCSIRENAELKIKNRLRSMRSLKKKKPGIIIGLLGCMADRIKNSLLEEEPILDLIAGPDAYRNLPRLLTKAFSGQTAMDIMLSADETYADINPVRMDPNGISAFISIMRGCENFCAYCVVPLTRGKERSRDWDSILREARGLFQAGYREITLLGQNVNSYRWMSNEKTITFPELLDRIALINPLLRIRFATSHPKDISDQLLEVMQQHQNICKAIHLPLQSGSDAMLSLMNRKYTRSDYTERVKKIRDLLPDCAVTTDIITGFCNETEEDHQDTLSLMEWVGYDHAYMFKYSARPQTLAAEKMKDNVPPEVKERRLNEIITLQQKLSYQSKKGDLGKTVEVLIEGKSKRSNNHLFGRTTQNKVVVFPAVEFGPGDYVNVKITNFTSATLIGEII